MLSTIGTYDPESDNFRFSCPHCGRHYKGTRKYLGTTLVCHDCRQKFLILSPQEKNEEDVKKSEAVDFGESIEGNILCPHCWETFSESSVLRISAHPDLLGDPVLGPMEQQRFVPALFNPEGIPLDEKNVPSPDMACPHCRLQIPESIVTGEEIYLSIVGAPSSGKSYYLTALIHELRKKMPERGGISFSDVDPRINKTLNEYEDQMFMATDKSQVVTLLKTEQIGRDYSDQTVLNGITVNLPKPFIFQMVPLSRDEKTHSRMRNIIFYDNAGEHFQPGQEKISNPATLHLVHSNAIFFIFDPLNDADMRGICNPEDPQISDFSKISNQTVLFSEMISRIRRHSRYSAGERSAIPLIIVVGKYDAWETEFPTDLRKVSPFRTNPESFEVEFQEDVIYSISFELREMMLRFAPGIVAQAEAFFETVFFIPVSSFGSLAECAGTAAGQRAVGVLPSKLNPVWVDVPFYLLMHLSGELPSVRTEMSGITPLNGRVMGDKIVFLHPEQNHKEQLPLNYAGRIIRINGKYCQLPGVVRKGEKKDSGGQDFWN